MVVKIARADIDLISDLIGRGVGLALFVKQQEAVDQNTGSGFQCRVPLSLSIIVFVVVFALLVTRAFFVRGFLRGFVTVTTVVDSST